ncbi:hypothetical protein N7466_007404 [Penicillium verhagenii]|uniref:uncharacterized protein n=1 Tax=Penicillium verhagenii TaxID=1562060 RepID=UPI00254589EC|nr:uncharacterized protein N7466_007404 [Penicillium verhagenii]KAJ5928448.1 hypothetical protein N7466_007404 [Penicillium verhagenii]
MPAEGNDPARLRVSITMTIEADAGGDPVPAPASDLVPEPAASHSREGSVDVLRQATLARQARLREFHDQQIIIQHRESQDRQAELLEESGQLMIDSLDDLQNMVDTMNHNMDVQDEDDQIVRDINDPQIRNWEADMLTRLIEIAYYKQLSNVPAGSIRSGRSVLILDNNLNFNAMTVRYRHASRSIGLGTLERLGLNSSHHRLLRRYGEFARYRSDNPFSTEPYFARWLDHSQHVNRQKYGFWGSLFFVCYGRTIRQSADLVPVRRPD